MSAIDDLFEDQMLILNQVKDRAPIILFRGDAVFPGSPEYKLPTRYVNIRTFSLKVTLGSHLDAIGRAAELVIAVRKSPHVDEMLDIEAQITHQGMVYMAVSRLHEHQLRDSLAPILEMRVRQCVDSVYQQLCDAQLVASTQQ